MRGVYLVGASAVILAASTLGSYAQDGSAEQGASNQQNNDPLMLTCAELRTMDTATVPGVLYFVSGYSAGQQGAGGPTSSDTDAGGSGDAAQNDAQSDASETEGDQTGSDNGGSDAPMAESGAADSGQVEIGRIAGYFNIPVEEVTVACEADPDRPVSELLGEESRRQGASGAGDDANAGKEAAAEAQTNEGENADAEDSGSGSGQ
ncbi:MAG TPA: HdeA/HdeB family chaperone [Devosiaceae bacterium]|nr:HdeA/HdeB family chaperone [Devosiaceae bacterium]